MKVNSRMPDFLRGRHVGRRSRPSALGERRIGELVEQVRHATPSWPPWRTSWTTASRCRGARCAELPQGPLQLAEEQDNGDIYNVAIEITDDEFVVDLRDNPDQDAGPNNASRDGAMIAAQMLFKSADRPAGRRPTPARSRRCGCSPGRVDLRRRARRRRSAIYYEVEIRLYDLIWRCLAPHLGGVLPAGSFASICGTLVVRRRTPTPGGSSRSSSRSSAAGAARPGRRQQRRSSAASTATPTTARPRSPRPATACTSTGSR